MSPRGGLPALALVLLGAIPPGAPDESILLDVPYLPQGRKLCGGAALAMVLRYWGEPDVYAEDFSELVDEDKGGIETGELVKAVEERGFLAFPIRGGGEKARQYLSLGRPLVALLGLSRDFFHYVVITGYEGEDLLVHDPSVGPDRRRSAREIEELWKKSDFWTLVVLPGESSPTGTSSIVVSSEGASVHPASDLEELSALRFREKNWKEAARFAEASLERAPKDPEMLSLLAASLYLSGEREEALDAWNQRDEPVVDRIEMSGLTRTRQEVVYRYLNVAPGTVLTKEALRKMRRRAAELPTVGRTRVSYEPLDRGRAKLHLFAAEGELIEPLPPLLVRGAVDALFDRTVRVPISSPTGGGERVEAAARFWENRPAVFVSLAAPGLLRLPGTAKLEAYAERQTYSLPNGPSAEESFRGMRLTFGEWLSSTTRAELGAGYEGERSGGDWIVARGAIEKRLASDIVSLRVDGSRWFSTGPAPSFGELGASIRARRIFGSASWFLRARLDGRLVTDDAPLAVWPRAGSEGTRLHLLRGYPLLENGIVTGAGFGSRLATASVEAERTVHRVGLARIGAAAFVDAAWADRAFVSPGAGLRVEVFGQTFRLDGAIPLDRGGVVFSAGWVESW